MLVAARTVFAEYGFEAPLRLVARTAGVGQGSLYRHFPTRESLAMALFEENLAEIETLAAAPESALNDVLAAVVAQLIESIAFIEIIDPVTGDTRLHTMNQRVVGMFATVLEAGRKAGAVRADITVEELLLALGMLAALLSRTPVPERPEVGQRAWELLRRGLVGR